MHTLVVTFFSYLFTICMLYMFLDGLGIFGTLLSAFIVFAPMVVRAKRYPHYGKANRTCPACERSYPMHMTRCPHCNRYNKEKWALVRRHTFEGRLYSYSLFAPVWFVLILIALYFLNPFA